MLFFHEMASVINIVCRIGRSASLAFAGMEKIFFVSRHRDYAAAAVMVVLSEKREKIIGSLTELFR